MFKDTIFHPSGQASLTAVREFIKLLPCAAVVADADTKEILAYSPQAVELTGASPDRWLTTASFLCDQDARAERLHQLEQQPDVPLRFRFELHNTVGDVFSVVSSMVLTQMAGRRVVITTYEPV